MKTVAFLYGWSEGPWHHRGLIELLNKAGLQLTKDASKADIILAHSLGCYMLPAKSRAKLVVLIGIPYWPGKSAIVGVLEGLKYEFTQKRGFKWWFVRSWHATFYILRGAVRTFRGLMRRRHPVFPYYLDSIRTIVVRNKLDPSSHPDLQKLLPQTQKYKFIELPGSHEDWWINPERYVDLLLKELN